MHKLIQKYMGAYTKAKGTPEEKIKALLGHYSRQWDWEGSDSILADILDDASLTAEDMVELLDGAIESGEGNREFHFAVVAIKSCLRNAFHVAEGPSALEVAYTEEDDYTDNEWLPHLTGLHHFRSAK